MTPTHEKSSMDASEMSDMIKAAKQQQLERSQKEATKRKPMVVATANNAKVVSNSADIASAEHGSYVQTEDGIGAIVVDHEVEMQKRQENDKTGQALLNLLNPNGLITDANQYIPDYGKDAPEGYDPGVQFINENPYDPKTKKLKDIKAGFSKLVPGLPGHGLVDADSDEGRMVAEAFRKLETGEVVLPTPEEYEQQKKEAKEKREREREERRNKAKEALKSKNSQPDQSIKQSSTPVEDAVDEPQMGVMPENAIIRKGVDDLLNALENGNKTNTQEEVSTQQATEARTPVKVNVEPPKTTPEATRPIQDEQPKEESSKVLNLAEAEEEVKEMGDIAEEAAPSEPEIKPEEVVNINVPAGEAATLMETLPIDTYNKVVRAKVVKVNEVELKDIPTATSRITNMADYKRLAKRRPKTKTAEITERVLINSGFVITLSGATSLEMATIFTSPTSTDVDWEKEYSFCYEHTVGTSLGKLSYNDFVQKVSPSDIETILDGIYEISETDTRKVSIICGTNDGGCGESYEVDAVISDLPNLDKLTEESKERIKKIIDAKGSMDETKRIVEDSPTSIVKYVQCGDDRVIALRTTTGNMMIERIDRIDGIGQTYGPLVALLMLYVENITITIKEREDAEPETFLLDTVDLICSELIQLEDNELQFVKDIITDTLKEYPTITYSIKGPCKCPHCGNTKKEIPCSISDLVFQKAQSVLA